MAIDLGTGSVTYTTQERTYRIHIETPLNGDPVVMALRQIVKTASDGTTLAVEDAMVTQRRLSTVLAETQPFTPATPGVVTCGELAELVAARADMWSTQDKANGN